MFSYSFYGRPLENISRTFYDLYLVVTPDHILQVVSVVAFYMRVLCTGEISVRMVHGYVEIGVV